MSFEHRVVRFAERYLSSRTLHLVVAPAIADLQFERRAGWLRRTGNHLAVLRALAGGARDDFARASSGMLLLTLLPAGYYIFLLVICFDVFSLTVASDFLVAATLIFFLSFAPVLACFWPERPDAPAAE
jgi:hypothetical protein